MELKLNIGQIITTGLSVLIISLLGWQFNTIRTLEMDNQLIKYKLEKIEAKILAIEAPHHNKKKTRKDKKANKNNVKVNKK
jgi:hypothetical protein